MKFQALNTATGLKPLYDEDYEEKRKLKLGTIYNVEVKEVRNYQFLKKYHALIDAPGNTSPRGSRMDSVARMVSEPMCR